ncbi:C-C motif chemokine 4-like isoform X2 [Oryzias melastigma]|uniref:C-C motif chemokine 4-like isoform X2 n=1 Tax=Oryzias melastigma TaxID=30732 RepID=UPI00168D5123|nr:C-C motif chemokine 4-like isoform X2 [Oryzias melastigma]
MKTLSVALLLLFVCCCSSMPSSQQCNTTPEKCCLKFSTNAIPVKNVTEILRTSSCCSHGAFIVTTTKGKEVCFKDDFKWAKRIFDRLSKDKEASGSS